MDTQELAKVLSAIQYEQSLDWITYIVISFFAGLGAWLASYFKAKGSNYANKEDFENLKTQLSQNTEVVEGIKNKLSEKNWISQQIWVKKQEAYEVVFELLFHVKKYVIHQSDEYQEWEYINQRHPYINNYGNDDCVDLLKKWEKEKEEYEEKTKDPKTKEEAEKLKIKYEESISSLFQILEVKAIYLDEEVEEVIKALKNELSITDEHEEWDDHFYRINKAINSTIDEIRKISKTELKIET